MRIEINAGGLGGVLAVHDYLNDIDILTQKSDSVIESFAKVKEKICNVAGGLGNLSEAVSMLNDRMQRDEQDKIYLYEVKNESQTFLDLAKEVDRNVEKMLNQSRKQFFAQNPWLKPQSNIEKWVDQAWSWICKGADYVYNKANDFADWCAGAINKAIDYAKAGWEWTKDTLSKDWNNLKEFYNKHKANINKILIGAVAIAVGVAVTVATGGAALPALTTMAGAALKSALIGAAFSGGISIIKSVSKGQSLGEASEDILSSIEDGFCSGFMSGAIFSAVGQGFSAIKNAKTIKFDGNVELTQNPYNDNYFIKGNNHEDFIKYYKSGQSGNSLPSLDSKIHSINPKDIEGVYLSNNEVLNPNVAFWRNFSRESTIEFVKNGNIGNVPVEVDLVDNKFFTFTGQGRHRIISAIEAGVNIPVRIRNYVSTI